MIDTSIAGMASASSTAITAAASSKASPVFSVAIAMKQGTTTSISRPAAVSMTGLRPSRSLRWPPTRVKIVPHSPTITVAPKAMRGASPSVWLA